MGDAMKNKKVYRVRAKSLDSQGRGVVSFNHSMIPVPGLLPGELAQIVLYRKGDETLGRILSIVEKSGERAEAVCSWSQKCGGCQLWSLNYEAQLKFKQEQVARLFNTVKNVGPVLGMDDFAGYRHKVHASFGRDQKGRIIAGIYEEHSHRILPVTDCRIQDPRANAIIEEICREMEEYKIQPYDEDTGRGMLRHVLIRSGYKTGQIMVVFVVATLNFPKGAVLGKNLRKKFPDIRTIVYNQNNKKTSMVLGKDQETIFGPGYIEDELCGMTFQISPKSFYQVNPKQAEVLYTKAMEMAKLTKQDRVLDTYCGTGTITLIAAKYAGEVTGVELKRSAVEDARINAGKNHMDHVTFVCADAARYMEQAQAVSSRYSVVIMDPPRSGSNPVFLNALGKMKPDRIIYISCNPATQKRDVDFLKRYGYRIDALQPVDMFPVTAEIENIALLRRGREKHK